MEKTTKIVLCCLLLAFWLFAIFGKSFALFAIMLAWAPIILVCVPCLAVGRKTIANSKSWLWKAHPFAVILIAILIAVHFCGGSLFNMIFATTLLSVAIEMTIISRGIFAITFGIMEALLNYSSFIAIRPDRGSLILAISVWILCGVGICLCVLLATTKSTLPPERVHQPNRRAYDQYGE